MEMDEKTFRWMMNEDAMATEKLAEGIRNFSKVTERERERERGGGEEKGERRKERRCIGSRGKRGRRLQPAVYVIV